MNIAYRCRIAQPTSFQIACVFFSIVSETFFWALKMSEIFIQGVLGQTVCVVWWDNLGNVRRFVMIYKKFINTLYIPKIWQTTLNGCIVFVWVAPFLPVQLIGWDDLGGHGTFPLGCGLYRICLDWPRSTSWKNGVNLCKCTACSGRPTLPDRLSRNALSPCTQVISLVWYRTIWINVKILYVICT